MATRWSNLPGLSDDVVERSVEDYKKYRKGKNVDKSNLKGGAREVVKEAGTRARNRNIGRAGAAGAAFEAGYGIGREIDERTGAGKKLVEKSGLGDLAAKAGASGPRVKLSQEAQDRVDDEGVDKILRNFKDPDTSQPGSEYKRGGKVSSASSRADGIATKGKTRGRFL
jgi:hypothetical protein